MPTASGPSRGQDLRGPGEQEVAGQDRDGVGPPGVGALVTAADDRLIHHVVVVQGGQMGQLDRGRGGYHARVRGLPTARRAGPGWPGTVFPRPRAGGWTPQPAGPPPIGWRRPAASRPGQARQRPPRPARRRSAHRDGGDQSGSRSSVIAAVTDRLESGVCPGSECHPRARSSYRRPEYAPAGVSDTPPAGEERARAPGRSADEQVGGRMVREVEQGLGTIPNTSVVITPMATAAPVNKPGSPPSPPRGRPGPGR